MRLRSLCRCLCRPRPSLHLCRRLRQSRHRNSDVRHQLPPPRYGCDAQINRCCLETSVPAKTVCDGNNFDVTSCNPCIDTEVPCTCKDDGSCTINYLPLDTCCDSPSITGPCEVGKCLIKADATEDEVTCEAAYADPGTACYKDDNPTCENAGVCDESGTCEPLGCVYPPPPSPPPPPPSPSPPPPSLPPEFTGTRVPCVSSLIEINFCDFVHRTSRGGKLISDTIA